LIVAQDVVLGRDSRTTQSRKGRLKITQDAILGTSTSEMDCSRFGAAKPRTLSWVTFSRPCGTARWHLLTQDCVLGYSQPSLRD
jgi:hypothetical protein